MNIVDIVFVDIVFVDIVFVDAVFFDLYECPTLPYPKLQLRLAE